MVVVVEKEKGQWRVGGGLWQCICGATVLGTGRGLCVGCAHHDLTKVASWDPERRVGLHGVHLMKRGLEFNQPHNPTVLNHFPICKAHTTSKAKE